MRTHIWVPEFFNVACPRRCFLHAGSSCTALDTQALSPLGHCSTSCVLKLGRRLWSWRTLCLLVCRAAFLLCTVLLNLSSRRQGRSTSPSCGVFQNCVFARMALSKKTKMRRSNHVPQGSPHTNKTKKLSVVPPKSSPQNARSNTTAPGQQRIHELENNARWSDPPGVQGWG